MTDKNAVVRIKPAYYIHVLDNNTNVTRVERGPQTFTRQDHEAIVTGPNPLKEIMIPPRNFVVISDPVSRDADGNVLLERSGQVKLRHGDEEIRFEQDPFPLYPGESLVGSVSQLQVVAPNTALKLRAKRDVSFEIKPATEKRKAVYEKHRAGDEWLFKGPGTYYPRVEFEVLEVVKATIIGKEGVNAIRLKARKELKDIYGNPRKAGEQWIVKEIGAYIPDVYEEIVETVSTIVLNERTALHLKAVETFTEESGRIRKAGEEWLVTYEDHSSYIPDVHEVLVGPPVKLTTLTSSQYAVVLDPFLDGRNQLGKKEVRRGPTSFFLAPGERLEKGIQQIYLLASKEALLLQANEYFLDEDKERKPGDRWMIYGPLDYVPPVQVNIIEIRRAIPLDETEGVYVRNIQTGKIRSAVGPMSFSLSPYEELWEKELTPLMEELLVKEEVGKNTKSIKRDKTRVVSYHVPHNSAVQIYDFQEKRTRILLGPDLVMLGPDEQFTVLSLSGDTPKRSHVIKSLFLKLGPDYSTDVVIVETSDHARLSLRMSYNWHFEIPDHKEETLSKLFSVPDFVGDTCKAFASLIRGAAALETFDNFHKHSADIIRRAVFGSGKNIFVFHNNNLIVNNIDIQSVEPVDPRTRDALLKSVQLAIEITTKSQEDNARHQAQLREQDSVARLTCQQIEDEAKAEETKRGLLELQSQNESIEAVGKVTAEAHARAEASKIEGEAAVEQARLQAEASVIASDCQLNHTRLLKQIEIEYQKQLNELEIYKTRRLAEIESSKQKKLIETIGPDTIAAIARAGPEMQARLLEGLNLQGYMITDGSSPINLFNTANGLIGGIPQVN